MPVVASMTAVHRSILSCTFHSLLSQFPVLNGHPGNVFWMHELLQFFRVHWLRVSYVQTLPDELALDRPQNRSHPRLQCANLIMRLRSSHLWCCVVPTVEWDSQSWVEDRSPPKRIQGRLAFSLEWVEYVLITQLLFHVWSSPGGKAQMPKNPI